MVAHGTRMERPHGDVNPRARSMIDQRTEWLPTWGFPLRSVSSLRAAMQINSRGFLPKTWQPISIELLMKMLCRFRN